MTFGKHFRRGGLFKFDPNGDDHRAGVRKARRLVEQVTTRRKVTPGFAWSRPDTSGR